MTSKRVSAPFDLRAELQSDDPPLKKQGTVVAQPTQTAPKKPTLTHTQTLVKPNSAAKKSAPPQKTISQPKPSAQKTISPPNSTPAKSVPPRKPFTNGLFRPLSDKQVDMLEREYYSSRTRHIHTLTRTARAHTHTRTSTHTHMHTPTHT